MENENNQTQIADEKQNDLGKVENSFSELSDTGRGISSQEFSRKWIWVYSLVSLVVLLMSFLGWRSWNNQVTGGAETEEKLALSPSLSHEDGVNQSYIVVQVDVPAHVLVTHESGVRVGSNGIEVYEEQPESWYIKESPPSGYGSEGVGLEGKGWNEVGIPTPLDGSYTIEIFLEEGLFSLEAFAYDRESNLGVIAQEKSLLIGNQPFEFSFEYSQELGLVE